MIDGKQLAQTIIDRYGTKDVYEIVKKAGINLKFEQWHPVTNGEFHRKTRQIRINTNAESCIEKVIAHELGHYFIAEITVERIENEEKIADDFSIGLIGE